VTPLETRSRQVRSRLYDPAVVAQLAVGVLAVGTLWSVQSLLAGPDKVEVTVVNPTEYDLDVTVRAPGDDARTLFGRVEREDRRTQPHLIDPGAEWVVAFGHDGIDLGELRLSDDELDHLGHTIEVPPEITTRAQEAGLAPTPD
jgi:hypothetical protein